MSLVEHAQKELELAGLFDEDSDYNGELGKAALEIVEVFAKQGHSGASAYLTLSIVEKLCRWENLTPLTDDPSEWNEVGENIWQNKRNPAIFSNDDILTA